MKSMRLRLALDAGTAGARNRNFPNPGRSIELQLHQHIIDQVAFGTGQTDRLGTRTRQPKLVYILCI